jgi:hypothetical protein
MSISRPRWKRRVSGEKSYRVNMTGMATKLRRSEKMVGGTCAEVTK